MELASYSLPAAADFGELNVSFAMLNLKKK
jgi:hypothetical protein